MLLKLISGVVWECDTIHVNLSPSLLANDTHSLKFKQEIIRSARQMGSYLAIVKMGVQIGLIDPNLVASIQPINPILA